MYTIILIKHKNGRPQGIVSNNVGIIISKLFSLIVQFGDKVSLQFSVKFVKVLL